MANFDTIKTAIDASIKTNGTQDITGGKMNSILKQIVDATGEQLTELESEVKKVGFVLGTFPSKIIMYDANSDSIFDYGAKSELFISESSWTSTPDSKSIFVPNQNKSKLVISFFLKSFKTFKVLSFEPSFTTIIS